MEATADATTTRTESHDPTGTRLSQPGSLRRTFDTLHSNGPAPGPSSDPQAGGVAEDVINPSHYRKHPSGIECIEVTRHMNFNTGNAVKYIWRYRDKGDPIENLKKAQWYLDDEIRRLQGLR